MLTVTVVWGLLSHTYSHLIDPFLKDFFLSVERADFFR